MPPDPLDEAARQQKMEKNLKGYRTALAIIKQVLSDAHLRSVTFKESDGLMQPVIDPPGCLSNLRVLLAKALQDYGRTQRQAQARRDAEIAGAEVDPHGDDCSNLHCRGYQAAAKHIATAIRTEG